MKRTSVRLGVTILVAFAVLAAAVVIALRQGTHGAQRDRRAASTPATSSESQLASANYKVLTPARTRALLRYADAAYACMSNDIELGKPRPERTKIVMTLPAGASPASVIRLVLRCSGKIGDPPKDASLQVRGKNLILYLPKYCILDKKVATTSRLAPLSP